MDVPRQKAPQGKTEQQVRGGPPPPPRQPLPAGSTAARRRPHDSSASSPRMLSLLLLLIVYLNVVTYLAPAATTRSIVAHAFSSAPPRAPSFSTAARRWGRCGGGHRAHGGHSGGGGGGGGSDNNNNNNNKPPPNPPRSRRDGPTPNGDGPNQQQGHHEEVASSSRRDASEYEVADGDDKEMIRDGSVDDTSSDEEMMTTTGRRRHVSVRGGASSENNHPKKGNPPRSRTRRNSSDNSNVVRGTQATLANTANFWSDAFRRFTNTISEPFRRLAPKRMFRSEQAKKQEELLHQLKTMPVQRIRVPNTTVLPSDVVQVAAKRCQLLGNALRMDRVQEFATVLGRWYNRQGYVLHGVTGATLVPDSATAEIAVVEPKVHTNPVNILFVKEMVVINDNEDTEEGTSQPQLLTMRQYKDMYNKDPRRGRKALLSKGGAGGTADDIRKQDLNTTFVTTSGRVKSAVIAAAMGLRPGSHFRWNSGQWSRIIQSPLFAKILQAKPAQMQDGTVQLQMIVQEAPLRHLEYGVGKSLYTNSWEGELEFEHLNLMGGGETLGVTVKRGTSEAAPSGKITFGNAKFGNPGGYQVQLFRDFLGQSAGKAKSAKPSSSNTAEAATKATPATDADGGVTVESPATTTIDVLDEFGTSSEAPMVAEVKEADSTPTSSSNESGDMDVTGLFDRKGLSFRIRNPIPQRIVVNSAGSATVERTTAVNGLHENICSTTLSLGPFVRQLPYDARSNVDATITTGTRVSIRHAEDTANNEDTTDQVTESSAASPATSSFLDRAQFLPYSTVTASTKQIFPLTQPSSRRAAQQPQSQQSRRPIVLALRHSVSTSSRHTPSYEAQALGNSVNIRGGEPNGNVKSCLRGTTELRVPITVPDVTKFLPKFGGGTAPAEAVGGGNDGTTDSPTADSTSLTAANAVAAGGAFATAPNPIRQDANVVLFGDWLVAAQDSSTTPLFRKTSVGVGVRKSIQGIPLSFDLTYSKELKFRTSFGLGRDFDV